MPLTSWIYYNPTAAFQVSRSRSHESDFREMFLGHSDVREHSDIRQISLGHSDVREMFLGYCDVREMFLGHSDVREMFLGQHKFE